jgi:hypothetical protein
MNRSVRWLLVIGLGPLVSVAWAGFVLVSPYSPSQYDPLPLRVRAFNSFADAAHILSLGLTRSSAIRCGNALDQDLSSYLQDETLALLPVHALGTAVCALVALVAFSVSWPRGVRIASGLIAAALALSWAAILLSGISPSGPWDIPCLILARTSVSLGPLVVLVLLSSGVRALRRARSEGPRA